MITEDMVFEKLYYDLWNDAFYRLGANGAFAWCFDYLDVTSFSAFKVLLYS